MTTTTNRFELPETLELGHFQLSCAAFLALEEIVRAGEHYNVELAPRVADELYRRHLIEFGRYGRNHIGPAFDDVFIVLGSTEPRDCHNARIVPNLPAWMDRTAAALILAPFALR